VPTRVFLIRHGESTHPEIFHGAESDVGLSERGRRQAAAVAPLLAAQTPTAVVSSAMRRARDTALPIAAACGLSLRIEPDLHERRVGALSGTPFVTTHGLWPQTLQRWMAGETAYAPDGAESFDEIRGRVLPVWERLTEEFAQRCLVVVAHGVVCKVLCLSILPGWGVGDWKRLGPIQNVALTELVAHDGTWEAVQLNHLPEELRLTS